MTDEIWEHDSLEVDEENRVTGSAHTAMKDGYDVQVGVYSYEYESHGESKMNHVPNVVVADESGRIVSEPHANDSTNPEKAIENGKGAAEYVFRNLNKFID